ncbi:RagB/SusD family nutrient uptake outer membrane protein [Hydrotalea sp.]|uniref:RagB/SusD family nutrient uptake outer membrane protein n=1 Tax=Hydrotalea sp. TaxID=2881279 RepID=UPI003D13F1A5
MKISNKLYFASVALFLVLISSGCNKKLQEHPYTVFTVDYFKSPTGLQSAVNALYSGMRFNYGPEGAVGITCDGTDEWTYADQPRTGAGGTADYLTLGNYTLDASNGAILTPWNRNYSNINLANAVVDFAPNVNMDTTLRNTIVAQARFFRGLYYLLLVEQFGAVPLDLGSGDLHFNSKPYQGFNRLPTSDLLVKNYQAMINDFTYATQYLPDQRPANAFVLSKAAAYLMLARTYIFRGYSAAKQSSDFQNAYNAAMEVINNQAKYGTSLLQNFADVNKQGNEYNPEILYSVERIPGDNNDNEVGNPSGIGGGKGVDASNDFTPDYTTVKAPTASSSTSPCATRTQLYGRPIRRFCPTAWLYNIAFADKYNDSRYDGSFRTVWLASQSGGGFNVGDTAIVLAYTNAMADSMNAIPKSYRVIAPREFYIIGGTTIQNIYPSLSKYEDGKKQQANDQGGRPFPVAKLSEMYLLAAEAAFQIGNVNQAVTLLNVIRERAAYRPGLSASDLATRVAAMDIDASQVTLDFILDERTRELCGESLRWPDLAMRGKLIERVKLYNPDGAAKIQPFHSLRPIPQSQLNATADNNRAQYQNPGY